MNLKHKVVIAAFLVGMLPAAIVGYTVGTTALSGGEQAAAAPESNAPQFGTAAIAAYKAHVRQNILANSVKAGVALLFVCAAVAWLGVRFVGQPIADLATTAKRMADDLCQGKGDLSKRIHVPRGDEIGTISKAFDVWVESSQILITKLAATQKSVSGATENLNQIVGEAVRSLARQQAETANVGASMEEMSGAVNEVARHAEAATAAAKAADEDAKAGRAVVDKAMQALDSLNQEFQDGAVVMQNLSSDSESIGSVVAVIRGIADQTNLLALNAAIEAARAGEQGRGFAVVADEVRVLASRTQQSTQQIEQIIEQLQNRAQQALGLMNNVHGAVGGCLNQASQANQALDVIINRVGQIDQMNARITAAAHEQGKVGAEVNRNVLNISHVGEESIAAAKRTEKASEHLSDVSRDLAKYCSMFKGYSIS